MILWLVGMMGSGKTSAGSMAAARLDVPFSDTDAFVAERMGCSIAQMWGTLGEAAFRDMEKVAVVNLAERSGIVSTGGGVVIDGGNREILSRSHRVVWLQASPEVLEARLEKTSNRPGLVSSTRETREFLTEMAAERDRYYAETATHRVPTDTMSVEEVAGRIEGIWNG